MLKRSLTASSSGSSELKEKHKRGKRDVVHRREPKSSGQITIHEYGQEWADWPAPRAAIEAAQDFILDIVENDRKVLIVPDKDADGLSAGYVLYKTLCLLSLPAANIQVHVLSKGTNVHSEVEKRAMNDYRCDRVIVLDQGSRPASPIVDGTSDNDKKVLIVDHHMSTEWPAGSLVLSACNSAPIATTSLLMYITCLPLHPKVAEMTDWAAVVGVVGDLGGSTAKWGKPPWPSHLAATTKRYGSKTIGDAVGAINAPRRTAEYNVRKAWDILLAADNPAQVASNAWLKLCRLDVNDEIARWARTPPKFSADGKVALITVQSGFQIHPVIATRWAGTLGRKSKKLVMIMCANTAFNPDQDKVSFSCRIAANLRSLPESERPNLINLLTAYGNSIEGFLSTVGGDFARGHKEATGGIIAKSEFHRLCTAIGIMDKKASASPARSTRKPIDAGQSNGIRNFLVIKPDKTAHLEKSNT